LRKGQAQGVGQQLIIILSRNTAYSSPTEAGPDVVSKFTLMKIQKRLIQRDKGKSSGVKLPAWNEFTLCEKGRRRVSVSSS